MEGSKTLIDRAKLKAQKRRAQLKRGYICKWCGGDDHYAIACFQRPKGLIAKESVKSKARRLRVRRSWFNLNPPPWECYLQISETCPKKLTNMTISLEHVRSKVRHPKLIFCVENIKPSCPDCNTLKGSWEILELAETYPRIFDMVTTAEWQEYEKQLDALEASL